jgi:tetratricopeptide (TPR) repeat protein
MLLATHTRTSPKIRRPLMRSGKAKRFLRLLPNSRTWAMPPSRSNLGIKKYQKSLRYLHEYPAPLDNDPADLFPKLSALKISVYLNCALLQNKTNQFAEALESTTKALAIEGISDKDKAKAYFRRGQAKVGKKSDEQALSNSHWAMRRLPRNWKEQRSGLRHGEKRRRRRTKMLSTLIERKK